MTKSTNNILEKIKKENSGLKIDKLIYGYIQEIDWSKKTILIRIQDEDKEEYHVEMDINLFSHELEYCKIGFGFWMALGFTASNVTDIYDFVKIEYIKEKWSEEQIQTMIKDSKLLLSKFI